MRFQEHRSCQWGLPQRSDSSVGMQRVEALILLGTPANSVRGPDELMWRSSGHPRITVITPSMAHERRPVIFGKQIPSPGRNPCYLATQQSLSLHIPFCTTFPCLVHSLYHVSTKKYCTLSDQYKCSPVVVPPGHRDPSLIL